jgi:tetratricopeptide (TPR) repeat protein
MNILMQNLLWRYEMDKTCRINPVEKLRFVLAKAGVCAIVIIFMVMSAVSDDAKDFEELFNKASLKYREGKYKEALKQFQKANILKGNADLESSWNIAQIYNILDQFDETLQACDQLATIAAGDRNFQVKALNLKGTALFLAAKKNPRSPDNQKFLQAEETFRRILKISPKTSMARYNLATALIWMHRTNEGIAELQTYIHESDDQVTVSKARRIIKNPQLAFEKLSPDFSIRTFDGAVVSLESLKGKAILLGFVSSLTGICESPPLLRLASKYKSKNFIQISLGVDSFITAANYQCSESNWKLAVDSGARLKLAFSPSSSPYNNSTFILIDPEGIIRFTGIGSITQINNELEKALNKILLQGGKESAEPSVNETVKSLPPPVLPENTFYVKIEPPQTAVVSIPQPTPEGSRADVIRIPKPNLKASSSPIMNAPPGIKAYILEIKNWASYSDELFKSYRNLEPCKASNSTSGYSSRLEVTAWNDQGEKLLATCSMTGANQLQRITVITNPQMKLGSKMLHVILKDRLTGIAVQSDPIKIP